MADTEIYDDSAGVLTGANDPVETEAEEAISDETVDTNLADLRESGQYESTEGVSSGKTATEIARDASGKFTKANMTGSPEATQTESGEVSSEATPNPDGYADAVQVMLREGFTEAALRAMPKDELVSSANGRIEQQRAGDGIGNQIRELKEQLAQRDKETGTDSIAEPSLLEKLEPRLKQMAEEGEGDLAEILRQLANVSKQEKMGPDPEFQKLQQRLEAQENAASRQQLAAARENLSEKWNLGDEIRYARIESEMFGLDKLVLQDGSPKYKDMDSLMNAAANIVYGDERIKQLESNLGVQHGKREAGQTTTVKQSSASKTLTSKDPVKDLLRELRKPPSEQDAGLIESLSGQQKRLPALAEMDEVLGVDERIR